MHVGSCGRWESCQRQPLLGLIVQWKLRSIGYGYTRTSARTIAFRSALRQARADAGLTQREVAAELDWSPSKIIRIENGSVSVSVTDLKAMLFLYKIKDENAVSGLVECARFARYHPWREYEDIYDKAFLEYIEYEESATNILCYQPLLMPGQIQTEAYARAVLNHTSEFSEGNIERCVALRITRQSILQPDSGCTGCFLLDEAVLRRQVGGADVHRAQLDHLLRLSKQPSIEIRVIPFAADVYAGIGDPFVIFEFDGVYNDFLFLESPRGNQVTRDDQELLTKYKTTFYSIFSNAIDLKSILPSQDVTAHEP